MSSKKKHVFKNFNSDKVESRNAYHEAALQCKAGMMRDRRDRRRKERDRREFNDECEDNCRD